MKNGLKFQIKSLYSTSAFIHCFFSHPIENIEMELFLFVFIPVFINVYYST